jgi:hypothetical protein
MKRQQIILPNIDLVVNYPQSFLVFLNNKQYKSEKAFIGYGNPNAKILVVTQKEGNEDVDFKYLKRLFGDFPGPKVSTWMFSLIAITWCMTKNY